MRTSAFGLLFVALIAALALTASAHAAGHQKASPTYFLVAQPDLPDPMFRDSVVLMLPPTGTPLVVGLIVNKPTKIKLSDLFPSSGALKRRSDTAYFGGPVGINEPLALIRSDRAPDSAVPLFKNIYLDLKPGILMDKLKNSQMAAGMRLYLGRAQWTDEQLHNEMLENSWYNVPSDPQYVFSADPATVWSILVARAQAIETSVPRLRNIRSPMLLQVTWPWPDMPGLDVLPPDR